MILQALNNLFDALYDAGELPERGLEFVPISWVIVLKRNGEFVSLESFKDRDGNGQKMCVKADVGRTRNVLPHCLWDKSSYVLGWEKDKGNFKLHKNYKDTFVQEVDRLAKKFPNNSEIEAVHLFYANNSSLEPIHKLWMNPEIAASDYITFRIDGEERIVASHPDIFDLVREELQQSDLDYRGVDLVTGATYDVDKDGKRIVNFDENGNQIQGVALANTHPHINISNTKPTASLVSFQKNSGFDSYGKVQGENAPISKASSFAHTAALNYLIDNEVTHQYLGDISYLFWTSSVSEDNKALIPLFRDIAFGSNITEEDDDGKDDEDKDDAPKKRRRRKNKSKAKDSPLVNQDEMIATMKSVIGGNGANTKWNSSDRFYILGLKGEEGRIAVRYWKEGTVKEIFSNLYQHLKDFNIVHSKREQNEENPPIRNLFKVLRNTMPPVKKIVTIPPYLIQSMVQSIMEGTPYPLSLQQAMVARVNKKGEVYELRAATLKACINRKIRTYHYNIKELTMALDKTNTNIAYVSGRLLAVLDQIQRAALGKVNATVVDRFYGSAATRPGSVIGRLIELTQHHLSKLRKENLPRAIYYDKLLDEIFSLIDVRGCNTVFPATFSLDEQSLFAVGYYHQKQVFFKSASKETDNENQEQTNNN